MSQAPGTILNILASSVIFVVRVFNADIYPLSAVYEIFFSHSTVPLIGVGKLVNRRSPREAYLVVRKRGSGIGPWYHAIHRIPCISERMLHAAIFINRRPTS